MTKALERIVGWGTLLVFLVLPITYFSGWVASYVTSKEFFFMGIVELLLVAWVWLMAKDRRYRLTKPMVGWLAPLAGFLMLLTVSSIAGVDPKTSFFSTLESGTGMVFLWHAFAFVVVVASLIRVRGREFLLSIGRVTVVASLILTACIYCISFGWFPGSAMLKHSSQGAMMGNILLAGAYLIFSVFMAAFLVIEGSSWFRKVMGAAALLLILLSPVFFSAPVGIGWARMATAALGIGIVFSCLLWLCLAKKTSARMAGIVGMVALVLVLAMAAWQVSAPGTKAYAFFAKESGNRITDWEEALQGFKDKPILGWGKENYHVIYQKYLDPNVLNPERGAEVWSLHPHNATLEILDEGGILSLLAYLVVLCMVGYLMVRLHRKGTTSSATVAILSGMLVAYFLQNQMVYDSMVSTVMFFSLTGILVGLSDQYASPEKKKDRRNAPDMPVAIPLVVTALMVPAFVMFVVLPVQKVLMIGKVGNDASNVRTGEYQALFHAGASYTLSTDPEFYTDPLMASYSAQRDVLKASPVDRPIATAEVASLIDATDPFVTAKGVDYHLDLSLVQLETLRNYLEGFGTAADLARAQKYYERGAALSPRDPQIYTAYGQFLLAQGDTRSAGQLADQALVLNPRYAPAQALASAVSSY